jgi:hypothetical protein
MSTQKLCNRRRKTFVDTLTGQQQIQGPESFEMLKTDDGRFAFRTPNNRFVTVEHSQDGLLVASQNEIRESDLFTLEEHRDSLVAFKSRHGKYVSLGSEDNHSLKANASSAGKSEMFRIMIMKDQVTITRTIEIKRSVTVNLGIHNYEAIAKHHKGWFVGVILNWIFSDKTRETIRTKIAERLDAKLKSRIEDAINERLDSQLAEEVTRNIQLELAENKIEATVVTKVK